MGNKLYNFYFLVVFCLGVLFTLFPNDSTAQDWRLSTSYYIQSVGFNYVPNNSYGPEISAAAKGILEIELERYLLHRFYVAGKSEFLFQNQEKLVIGGPVDFKQVNLGATTGLQWPKLGVYGGVKVGSVWDFNIKATNSNGDVLWVPPVEKTSALTTSITGGIKYYLLNFIRLQLEVSQTNNLPQNVIPQSTISTNPEESEYPAFRSFDFKPLSFSVGVSISIPWNKRKGRSGSDTKLPPLMRLSGVSFSSPMNKTYVTSEFGPRWNSTHDGVDLEADRGDNIMAVEKGIVIKAGKGRGYGKMVRIKHANGFETVYAHMNRIRVKEGDRVRKGQVVGKAGNTGTSTGVHLHFEIIKDGTPVNPQSYLRF